MRGGPLIKYGYVEKLGEHLQSHVYSRQPHFIYKLVIPEMFYETIHKLDGLRDHYILHHAPFFQFGSS